MTPSQRLVVNTTASYTRSLIAAGLTLFSSRWVLNALGQVDYGLFSLVGSILIFIAFLNSVMANSASRHFAYAIGQGDDIEVNRWFNAAFSIHLCMALGLTSIGWLAGEYIIGHILNIPQSRVTSSILVFRISLLSLFTGMFSIPFVAMFKAKQRIAELSAWEMSYSIFSFTLAWFLIQVDGDRLIFYAGGITGILVLVHILQILRAAIVFQECKLVIEQWFDKNKLKELFSFAIWNLIGALGGTLRDNGSAILLNLYFGPKVNASYNIAKQVSVHTGRLAGAMLGAFSPEITSREGAGDRSGMITLALRASKFGTLLVLVFTIPLIMEMNYVLKVWLVEPPVYAATLCRFILCMFLIDRISTGYMLAVNAHGRIAGYQATLGTALVLTLPLAWVFFDLGFKPTSVGYAFLITMTICSIGRVLWARHLLNAPVRRWVVNVLAPTGIVTIFSVIIAIFPLLFLPSSFLRLVCVVICSSVTFLLTTWKWGLDSGEKTYIRSNIQSVRGQISNVSSKAKFSKY